ncbi:MAG TPA: chemotaxis protein CheA [Elusimicrobia bacterium]|jgi:two-component system chemotaxis sensor kinase CheA|nr:chemotaxis protein CheA [Elusimicrobiota bacterium]
MVEEMDMSQFRDLFLAEANEYLQGLNQALLQLARRPEEIEPLNEIFRLAHTLKGMSATMGYTKITELTHQMEDVLDKLRKGESSITPETIDIFFECFDILEILVEEVTSGEEKKVDLLPILSKLRATTLEEKVLSVKEVTEKKEETVGTVPSPSTVERKKKMPTVRVKVEYLDTLMNLIGELVIVKAQINQLASEILDVKEREELSRALNQFERVSTNLQEEVLKTRMAPLGLIFERFPRILYDLTQRKGYKVNLEIYGSEIEVDRIITEQLSDCLIHILRNALDHGIESPEEREKFGKATIGTVKFLAYREASQVVIEVVDDGKGMDPAEIRRAAIGKGLISSEEAFSLSEEEVLYLVTYPQFSTAKEVTDVSGRGVGLDVVKTRIESFNGKLEIKSKKGEGSRFILKLPLTLVVIRALLVKIDEEVYAIPVANIRSIAVVNPEEIKTIENQQVIVLRQEVIPLIRLSEVFSISKKATSGIAVNNILDNSSLYVIVVEATGKKKGFVVSGLLGHQEVVIKSLTGLAKNTYGFSGATILGDGRVVLIIDVLSLVTS